MIERIASIIVGILLLLVGVAVIGLDVWKNAQLHAVNGGVGVLFAFAGGLLINTARTKAIADAIDEKAGVLLPFLRSSSVTSPTQWPPQVGPTQ